MKKFLKYALIVVGVVVIVVGTAVAYVLLTFNPNSYKPQVIQAVKEKTERNLKLDGEIKLTIFPSIGVDINKVSLSEFRSKQEFASIDHAHVSLALLPLLSRRVVVDEVAADGVKATLIKRRDGKLNIDDLISGGAKTPPGQAPVAPKSAKPAAAAPVAFDIAAVSLDNTTLNYRDETTGAHYSVKDLRVKTGRIANGKPTQTELDVTLQGNKPKVDIALKLRATLTIDLEKQRYRADGLDLQAKGEAAGIRDLDAAVSGDVGADLAANTIDLKGLVLTFSGTQDNNGLSAKLSVPGMKTNGKTFRISELTLDAGVKQPDQAFKVTLSSPVEGNIEAQQISLPSLKLSLNATGDKLPNKSVSSELSGSVRLDAKTQAVAVKLSGGLLQSKIKADATVKGFDRPAIRFAVDVDQFDADLYLPKQKEGAGATAGAGEQGKTAPEQPFDLTGLRSLTVDGSLTLGALKVVNIKASKLKVDIKAKDGRVSVPLSLNLYKGSARLDALVNAAPAIPQFALKGKLADVEVGPLAKDAANLDLVEGRGNIALNLTTQGNRVSALKKGLNGTVGVNLGNGAIKGINLQKLVQGVQSLSKETRKESLGIGKDEKTAFTQFRANFKVHNGVAHNDDLSVKSPPTLHITGNGNIDIGNETLGYTAKATFAKTEGGGSATLPVHLGGTFSDPQYKVDTGALVKSVAKQKVEQKVEQKKKEVEQKKEELKSKAKEELKGKLKGLFH